MKYWDAAYTNDTLIVHVKWDRDGSVYRALVSEVPMFDNQKSFSGLQIDYFLMLLDVWEKVCDCGHLKSWHFHMEGCSWTGGCSCAADYRKGVDF